MTNAATITDIRDIKPPIEIANGLTWLWWLLGALAIAALLLAWRHFLKRVTSADHTPVVPPHVRAKKKLEEALALISQPKEFCVLVSDTVRFYLEERFQFRAPERTTEEFLHELGQTDLLAPEQKESLGKFLESCDLVKFAKYEPRENELRDLHSSALQLVEETEPREIQKPEVRIQEPENLKPVQKRKLAEDGKLAITGVILQLGNGVFFFAYFVGLTKELKMVQDLPSQMAHSNSIDFKNLFEAPLKELNQLQGIWEGVLIASGIGILIGIVGLVLILISLTKQHYRAEWFFWFLVIYSLILLGAFPFGTIFGIFFLVYCLTKRHEFSNSK